MRTCFICGVEVTPATSVWAFVPMGKIMLCKTCAKIAAESSGKDPCPKCGSSAFCPENYACTEKKASMVGDLNANQAV